VPQIIVMQLSNIVRCTEFPYIFEDHFPYFSIVYEKSSIPSLNIICPKHNFTHCKATANTLQPYYQWNSDDLERTKFE